MRVTAKGEYASQAVLHLALQYPEVVTIQEIASRHHIPLKYLEQILLELKRGGVLESRRGVKGGYLLARAPAKISVVYAHVFSVNASSVQCMPSRKNSLRRVWLRTTSRLYRPV